VQGHPLEGGYLAAEPRWKDLLELCERAEGSLLDASDLAPGRRAEPDRHRHRFVVVEEQRWHRRAGLEPVAADGSSRGMDGVAEVAQPLDVVPDRAGADLEALGKLRPRPVPRGLEQREQPKEPCGRSHVSLQSSSVLGTKST
jgi:hypothetical protein